MVCVCGVIRCWRPRSATLETYGNRLSRDSILYSRLQVGLRGMGIRFQLPSSREEGMDPSIHLSLNSVSKNPRLESLCGSLIYSHALDRHARATIYSITSPLVGGREGPALSLVVASRHIHRGKGPHGFCVNIQLLSFSSLAQTHRKFAFRLFFFAYHLPLFFHCFLFFCQHVPCRISISVVEGT